MRRLLAGWAVALLAAPAAGAELPSVPSGERPGPPLLYEPPPVAPQLSVQAPFAAPPLLVSGTDAYRQGEYLYQDYLFDDRGADTVPGSGSRGEPGSDIAASTAGDVMYPTAARYAGNAADIVELRIKPTPDAIVYRVTLNSVVDDDTAIVGIGIDTDRSGGPPVPWPLGAGVSSPGLDAFVTAHGTGGMLTTLPAGPTVPLPAGSVSIDTTTNQMTIRVPRSSLDPGGATWRYVAGAGLWDGAAWKPVPPGGQPGEETPASGNPAVPAPAVFNLAFRFDEPQTKNPTPPYTTFPGVGIWFEDKQSRALAAGVTDCSFPGAPAGCAPFHADVDFSRLAAGASEQLHSPPGREQARIMSSGLQVPEGLHEEFPAYGGPLQPYLLTVPPGYDPARPAGLTFALHSLGGTYTQFAVFSPNQLRQFGDERDNIVVTPHGRGTNGWYTDEAEADVFEVWRDVARHFSLDPERVALSGYSMGGYGTYKLGTQYPDLFGRAFTTVGPPAREAWIPPNDPVIVSEGGRPNASSNSNLVLENARWIPYMNWVEVADQLVPYPGPRAQQARFDSLGLRSSLWSFTPGDHFTLALLDRWDAARDFLGEARVERDPWRVNYAFVPAADRPALGLVHDHAYWVSGLRARSTDGDPGTDPSRGEIDARSLAFGLGDPVTRPVRSAGPTPAPPQLSVVEGTDWASTPRTERENALELGLENVSAATIDGRRARLDGERRLRVTLVSDGRGRTRLELPLPEGVTAERVEGDPVPGVAREVELGREGATFAVASGRRTYVIDRVAAERRVAAQDGGGGGTGGSDTGGGGGGAPSPGSTTADTGDGGSLPFTGLALGALALAGAVLLAGGRMLRR